MGALAFASTVLSLLPAVVKGVTGAYEAMSSGAKVVKELVADNRDPNDDEWAALNAAKSSMMGHLLSDDN